MLACEACTSIGLVSAAERVLSSHRTMSSRHVFGFPRAGDDNSAGSDRAEHTTAGTRIHDDARNVRMSVRLLAGVSARVCLSIDDEMSTCIHICELAHLCMRVVHARSRGVLSQANMRSRACSCAFSERGYVCMHRVTRANVRVCAVYMCGAHADARECEPCLRAYALCSFACSFSYELVHAGLRLQSSNRVT